MRILHRRGVSVFVVLAVAGCGGSTTTPITDVDGGGGDGGGGGTGDGGGGSVGCKTDTDCGPAGNYCGFQQSLACSATGTCFDVGQVATCAAYSAGCACDGTEINVACSPLPQGYVSKALAHTGACTPGETDGGAACKTSSDCQQGFGCGFPSADGCSAVGTCFDISGPQCSSFSAGCACDNTTMNVACNGFPQGYDPKPLLHPGKCD